MVSDFICSRLHGNLICVTSLSAVVIMSTNSVTWKVKKEDL